MDLVVGADARVLGLQGEGEGGDMERQDVRSVTDLTAVQQTVHQSLSAAASTAVVGTGGKQCQS